MDELINNFSNMSIGQLFGDAIGLLLLLSTCIEIAPIKISPISSFLCWLGRKINKELFDKVADMETKVNNIEYAAAEREAVECRVRILRFADEIYHEQKHSKEHYEQMLSDIDWYEKYCMAHPEFKNNKAVIAKKRILDVYSRHLENNDFL